MRMLCMIMTLATVLDASAEIIYVDVDAKGGNSGRTWMDAHARLQDALARASSGDQIWVAEGRYLPTSTRERTISFRIPGGVELYGGFSGLERSLDERDWARHVCILSGNLGDPDSIADNSYRIVEVIDQVGTVVVDGFTISESNNNREGVPGARGGGIYVVNCDIVVRHCRVVRNFDGGGAWVEGGQQSFAYCEVSRNYPLGLLAWHTELAVVGCVFEKNAGTTEGAGVASQFSNCTIQDTAFVKNVSVRDGGGFYAKGIDSHHDFDNCTFIRNKAGQYGAGARIRSGSVTVTNCTFFENVGWSSGNGLGAGNEPAIITNTIFWGNQTREGERTEQRNVDGNDLTINNSCVQGWTGNLGGVGNHGEDPLFVNEAKGDVRLSAGSPCTDRGDNQVVTRPLDLDGNPRIVDGTVDMGPYESVCSQLSRLKASCSDGGLLKAKLKTALPEGGRAAITNTAGKPRACTVKARGVCKTKWRHQSGELRLCPAGCNDPCRKVQCP